VRAGARKVRENRLFHGIGEVGQVAKIKSPTCSWRLEFFIASLTIAQAPILEKVLRKSRFF
jgi:hypothetical protein